MVVLAWREAQLHIKPSSEESALIYLCNRLLYERVSTDP